jgi:nucleotidyltransferase/DNA polymerase involved in DNA repair
MPTYNLHWRGMLTKGNIFEVTKLCKLLLNRRRFAYAMVRPTWVPESTQVNSHVDTRVNLYTRQQLREPISGDECGIVIPTTEYLCMFETNLTGPRAEYDYMHKNPHFAFDGDRLTVRWQTPCGDQAIDVFTLEVR